MTTQTTHDYIGSLAFMPNKPKRVKHFQPCIALLSDNEGIHCYFRFLYYEKETLTGDIVMTVLYLAKKYQLNQLLRKCNVSATKIRPSD